MYGTWIFVFDRTFGGADCRRDLCEPHAAQLHIGHVADGGGRGHRNNIRHQTHRQQFEPDVKLSETFYSDL